MTTPTTTAQHPMPRRRIGSLDVPTLGLGCMGMSTAYGRTDKDESLATLDEALDLGVNLWDTADMYGNGRNESLLGEALTGRRDRVVLATKMGITTLGDLPTGVDGRPERVRACCEASLKRLGTDHIDLYYLHRPDPKVPIEETIGAFARLVEQGKVREVGVSEVTAEQLRRAHGTHPIAALQSEWSIFNRDLERDSLPVARELGVTVVPYSPLGRGMLTGDPRATRKLGLFDFRRFLPQWSRANREHNFALVGRIGEIAGGLGLRPSQVALAWLLQQGDDVVPIPGTKRRRWLRENVAATTVRLPADVLAELDAMRASGERYGSRSAVNAGAARDAARR